MPNGNPKQATRHLLFLDESGEHDMQSVNPDWPVFVLVGVLVGEKYYQMSLVPRIKRLKAKYGLSRSVVLHSRDIRRWEGDFQFLCDLKTRQQFMADLSDLIESLRIRLFASVID